MRRPDLIADCASCAAVCCVATTFDASDDFAFAKPANVACSHLRSDCRCAIHESLVARGFPGCSVYDCYGAGPSVTRAFSEGDERYRAFMCLRIVHELLWQLTEAVKLCPAERSDVAAELGREIEALDAIASMPAAALQCDLALRERATRDALARLAEVLGGRGARRKLHVVG